MNHSRGATILAIALIVVVAALLSKGLLGTALLWTGGILLALILLPIVLVLVMVWRVKRKMRKAVQDLHATMAQAQAQFEQELRAQQARQPGNVIDVEAKDVTDVPGRPGTRQDHP